MKKMLCRVTVMLALAFSAAYAVEAQEPVLANIPFAFTAGAMTLPAGEYRIGNLEMGSAVLLIQGTDSRTATLVMSRVTEANRPQSKSKLIFHCYGKRYFLSQIWVEGNSRGIELPRSAQEKEALQASNHKPEEVTIVARLVPSRP
jgi:hypothetical protein